jgi:hypothetical protein
VKFLPVQHEALEDPRLNFADTKARFFSKPSSLSGVLESHFIPAFRGSWNGDLPDPGPGPL